MVRIDDKVESDYLGVQEQDVRMSSEPMKYYQIKSLLFRQCLAEFLGTLVMIMFGDGVVAQVVLSQSTKGGYLSINLSWGLGVLFGIHVSGGVSGAHLNPAVTTTLAIYGRMEWRKVPYYIFSQIAGAFIAALLVWIIYFPMLKVIDPEKISTQGIFATYSYSDDVPVSTCFLTEVVGTALLLGCIFAFGDELNKPTCPYTHPSAVALLVVAIGMAFGMNSGYAINPARDFGPRVFSWIAGWGSKVFTLRDSYFWVPIIAPLVGGPIGAGIYVCLIEHHHHPRDYKDPFENQ